MQVWGQLAYQAGWSVLTEGEATCIWGKAFQAEGTARSKALGWEWAWGFKVQWQGEELGLEMKQGPDQTGVSPLSETGCRGRFERREIVGTRSLKA